MRFKVSNGISGAVRPSPKTTVSGSSKRYIPNGSVKKEDLKCMVCYQEFAKDPKSIVILCPECKYPAHELELHQWLNQSSKCPRCAKNIKSNLHKILQF